MESNLTTQSLRDTDAECAAGRTAPRVSLSDIEANIAYQVAFTGANAVKHLNAGAAGAICGTILQDVPTSLDVLTICLVVMRNGFTIIGKAAPASPANFDAELGAKLAYEDAIRQVWPLMGYALREKLTLLGPIASPTSSAWTRYAGTKAVAAIPMTRGEYLAWRQWDLPPNEDAADEGYAIEYLDGGKPNLEGWNGYITWTPKDVFDRAYRPI